MDKQPLKFVHRSQQNHEYKHIWGYVYLHGQAAVSDHELASDLCIANQPISNYVPVDDNIDIIVSGKWNGTISIPCYVNDVPAACVISTERFEGRHDLCGGRIALIHDIKAMKYIYEPTKWA